MANIDILSFAMSTSYTDEEVAGGGAIKGKNCQIKSKTAIEGGTRITFAWYLDNGTEKNTTMDVMDGQDGSDGAGITNITVSGQTITIYYDDGKTATAEIPTVAGQDGKDGADGVSPTVSTTSITGGTEVTITDATGDHTFDVMDGADGLGVPSGGTTGQVLAKKSGTDNDTEWVDPSGGGDASLESAVTSNLTVGAIASGTTLPKGTTFTEFAQKLLITEIAPTTTFTASGSGVKEVGTSVTPTLILNITALGTGTPTAIKFYDGSTLLNTQSYVDGTNSYTYTMEAVTTTKTVKGVLEYKKSDNTSATVEKSATYTFVMASYYGAVATAPTDKSGITALTKNVKNTKAQTATFTLSNQRSCYCYPASFGDLTSIKDANNFEYLSSYTKTTVSVDDVNYNVYTLTDPVTATGFKQVYA